MLSYSRIRKVALLSISLTIALTSKAFCGDSGLFDDFDQGHWRFESLVGSGLSSRDKGDRKGDYYLTSSLEYEWPIYKSRTNLALRGYPALIYYQDRNNKAKNDTVFAAAFGPALRQYQHMNHKGFYWEIGVSLMWNSRLFRRNASHWNFLSEIGVGHQFDSDWHIALKLQHISNARTRSPNDGVNALALCLGFPF